MLLNQSLNYGMQNIQGQTKKRSIQLQGFIIGQLKSNKKLISIGTWEYYHVGIRQQKAMRKTARSL